MRSVNFLKSLSSRHRKYAIRAKYHLTQQVLPVTFTPAQTRRARLSAIRIDRHIQCDAIIPEQTLNMKSLILTAFTAIFLVAGMFGAASAAPSPVVFQPTSGGPYNAIPQDYDVYQIEISTSNGPGVITLSTSSGNSILLSFTSSPPGQVATSIYSIGCDHGAITGYSGSEANGFKIVGVTGYRASVSSSGQRTCPSHISYSTPQSAQTCESNPGFGNPIFPLSGEKTLSVHSDAWFEGRLKLTYNSTQFMRGESPQSLFVRGVPASFGDLWSSNYHKRLAVDLLQDAPVLAARGGGNWVAIVPDGTGKFRSESSGRQRIEPLTRTIAYGTDDYLTDGWLLFDADTNSVEIYSKGGRLLVLRKANGEYVELHYSGAYDTDFPAPGLLASVADQFGRSIRFEYHSSSRPLLARTIGSGGVTTSFFYDVAGNMNRIAWPDATGRGFVYDDPRFPWALTGIIDELGVRTRTYGYDSSGRANLTYAAGGVDRYEVTWSTPPVYELISTYDPVGNKEKTSYNTGSPAGTIVSVPNGQQIMIESSNGFGTPFLSTKSQPAGSGCAASSSSQAYDSNGNVILRDDFSGSRTCIAYDLERNLERARVEGVSAGVECPSLELVGSPNPVGSRRISTQWHGDWRLNSKMAEPGRISTYIYNGQPDPFNGNALASCAPGAALLPDGKPIVVLCKRVEQATTDANGSQGFAAALQAGVASRVWTYTYNQFGQVLTAKGPRSDVDDTTTYTYYSDTTASHMVGDLASSRNALNQTTQYTSYNAAGQLMQMVDPNGVVTDNVYDVRRRLVSTTVAGQATVYTYDLAGQLTRVSLADGSFAGFEYDAAQRQTAVFDNIGNRIEYTLDSSSNRIGERVKDPDGVLRRVLTRSVDALGRVQQVVGRE